MNPTHYENSLNLHLAASGGGSSNVQLTTIMGLQAGTFYAICGGLAIVIAICLCILVMYRRRRTLQDYNENPERFPNLPELTYFQERHLKN